ncbi:MAG: ornithine cyclodeaminase family protein [Candidatus Eremiobacteraeota bacterium]|nr:ornithine cyclodeaminase family protein [Candidatus Eremiobacteraeota bacterium]
MSTILYLSLDDVKSLAVPMAEILERVEKVFQEKGLGHYEMPPKPGIHPMPDAFIHAMPSHLPRMSAAGIKWVSGFPENQKKGLPYISGLLILNDPETGIPLAVMDCTWITAMRTAAATAVSAKYCARRDSETVAMLACGVQGRTNLEALSLVCPHIKEVRAYDINGSVQERYVKDMGERFNFQVRGASGPEEAVRGSDIIVTSGPIFKHPSPVIEKSWLKKGVFIGPVDFDSYVKPEVLTGADRFITDDRPQILYYQSQGYFLALPERIDELCDVVTGKIPGRTGEEELIVGMNLGISLLDMGTARLVHDKAKALKKGTGLPL